MLDAFQICTMISLSFIPNGKIHFIAINLHPDTACFLQLVHISLQLQLKHLSWHLVKLCLKHCHSYSPLLCTGQIIYFCQHQEPSQSAVYTVCQHCHPWTMGSPLIFIIFPLLSSSPGALSEEVWYWFIHMADLVTSYMAKYQELTGYIITVQVFWPNLPKTHQHTNTTAQTRSFNGATADQVLNALPYTPTWVGWGYTTTVQADKDRTTWLSHYTEFTAE